MKATGKKRSDEHVSDIEETKPEQAREITEALKNLMKLVGDWEGEATLKSGDETYSFTYRFKFREAAEGRALYMDESFEHEILGRLRSANLIGYDPFENLIRWFTVDNIEIAHEHTGQWKKPDHLYMEHSSERNGMQYREEINIIVGDENFDLKVVSYEDKEVSQSLECKFRKIS